MIITAPRSPCGEGSETAHESTNSRKHFHTLKDHSAQQFRYFSFLHTTLNANLVRCTTLATAECKMKIYGTIAPAPSLPGQSDMKPINFLSVTQVSLHTHTHTGETIFSLQTRPKTCRNKDLLAWLVDSKLISDCHLLKPG